MKAKILILAVLALRFTMTAALAQEYYTLPEIREQAKEGWHETYTDRYGREITVDIDVDVFGEEKAPVVKVGYADYRVNPDELEEGAQTRKGPFYINKNNPYNSVSDVKRSGGRRTHLYRTFGEKVDEDKAYGEAYENDLTPREMVDFMLDILNRHGLDVKDEFFFEQPKLFDVLCNVDQKTQQAVTPAFYMAEWWTKLYGMPILEHAMSGIRTQGWPLFCPRLDFMMRNENEYSMYMVTVKEIEKEADDIPLCAFGKVIENLEALIENGTIQRVFSLQFGYVLYNEPGHPNYRRDIAYDHEADYYAVPSWVIDCAYMKNPKDTFTYDYEKEHQIDPDTCERNAYQTGRIAINAQTGKITDIYDKSKGGYGDADYKGFISWDDVK